MSECRYDCSENATSALIPPNDDISGIGVVIGYTVTAGLAVLILTGYYFLAHQPDLDPFRKDSDTVEMRALYKPHPVDEVILHYVHKSIRKIKNIPLIRNVSPTASPATDPGRRPTKLKKPLLKCVLMMSDLQIVTGLSILISGYSQLQCGISIYHWQIMIYLAWFCSLTHLSCLTFLRNYLYNHPGERLWRLVAMGALISMLIVALLPTGNYGPHGTPVPIVLLNGTQVTPAMYAICSFKRIKPYRKIPNWDIVDFDYASMVISILFMTLGFLSRIVKLHRRLSMSVFATFRNYLSVRARMVLRKLYVSCEKSPNRSWLRSAQGKRLFFYRPALAIFLTVRLILDIWSSLAFEVWWLTASFFWGVNNLILSRSIPPGYRSRQHSSGWTFGQIAPVILLVAPLLSIVEVLFEESPHDIGLADITSDATVAIQAPSRTETMELAFNATSTSDAAFHDDPDHDFYKEKWFRLVIAILLLGVLGFFTVYLILLVTLTGGGSRNGLFRVALASFMLAENASIPAPLAILSLTTIYISCFLLLEDLRFKRDPFQSTGGITVLCTVSFVMAGFLALTWAFPAYFAYLSYCSLFVILYVTTSCIHLWRTRTIK